MAQKKKTKTKTRKVYVKAKKSYRRASGILGSMLGGAKSNLGLKSIAYSAVALPVVSRFQPFGGRYKGAIDMVAAGFIGNAVKCPSSDLISAGVKIGIANVVDDYLLGSFLGSGQSSVGGGVL